MKARFEKLSNDLFWNIYDSENDKIITWQGYDDSFWWSNVSKTDNFRIRGKYKLNPETDDVIVLENKSA
jgi:hypothetical protein